MAGFMDKALEAARGALGRGGAGVGDRVSRADAARDGRVRPAVFGGSPREIEREVGRGAARRDNFLQRNEKRILGVPERFMRPRIVLVVAAALLAAFGLLMIYSASSVTAISLKACDYDPAYYLKRQAIFLAVGVALAVAVARVDYHRFTSFQLIFALGIACCLMLILVYIPGFSQNTYGASRWVKLGSFQLQPSEFAKPFILVAAAPLFQAWARHEAGWRDLIPYIAVAIVLPLVLILGQPDKGTTAIIAVTLILMAYLSGVRPAYIAMILGAGVLALLAMSLTQDYALTRIMNFIDPWRDELGESYQLIQGFYAFGSGGLFGVGIGFSKQKYSYLPMAYNDFIYAVVGEECGLVGTLGVLMGFAAIVWAGFKIARYAPDLSGRLIACGCSSMLLIQMLVNACGVLGMIPMTGKPLPFLSYGGSSIMSSVILVGLIVCVSRSSSLPETEHDRARRSFEVRAGGDPGLSFVGEPHARSERYGAQMGADAYVSGPAPYGYGDRPASQVPRGASGLGSPAQGSPRGFTVMDGGSSRVGRGAAGGRGRAAGPSGAGRPRTRRR